ncbi:MAG: acyl-CoA synthetase, partial [Acidimicrobiia bacterium]|nr:acyl-CoA synthetase [Acidimicrobiia bacterium]
VGVPDERFGELVTLVCSVSAPTTAADVIATVKGSIADYKAPRRVVFVDEVYRAPNGKADYRLAREQAIEEASG